MLESALFPNQGLRIWPLFKRKASVTEEDEGSSVGTNRRPAQLGLGGGGGGSVIYLMVGAWEGVYNACPGMSCAAGLYSILKTLSTHKIMSGKQGSVLYRY
jgi:hypothetical protein